MIVVYVPKVDIEVCVREGLLVFGVQDACRVLVIEVDILIQCDVGDKDTNRV